MAARLIVQLLRMLRTPEEEIAELLNRKPMMAVGQEPSAELVRKLCMLQLDIIADMATATAELRASYRRQIDQLWQAHLAQDEVVNGGTRNGMPSKISHVNSASLSSRSSSSSSSVSSSSSTSSSSEDISKAQPLIDLSNGDESTFSGKKEELITKKKKSSAVSSDDDDNSNNSNNSCTSRTSSSSSNNNNKDTDLTTSSGSAENLLSMKTIHLLYMLFRKLTMPEWMVDSLLNELNTADSPLFGTEGPSTTDQQTSSSSSSSSSAAAPLELFSRLLAIEEEFSGLPAASTADGHTLAGYRELVISLWSAYYRPPPLEEAAAAAASSTFSTPKQSQSRAEALVSRCAEASRAGGLGRETTMTVVNPAPNSVLFNGGGGAVTKANEGDDDDKDNNNQNSTTTTKVTPLVAPTLSSHSLAVAKANTVALVERTFEQHLRPFRGTAAAHQDAPATPEYLKEVVNCLSKAIKQCRQFVRDEQVQARAVAALLPKLPEAMRAAFADRCERRIDERSLRHLKLFVSSEMAVLYAARGVEQVGNKQQQPQQMLPPPPPQPQLQQFYQGYHHHQPQPQQQQSRQREDASFSLEQIMMSRKEPPQEQQHQQQSLKPSFAVVANAGSKNYNNSSNSNTFNFGNFNSNFNNHHHHNNNSFNDNSDSSSSEGQQQQQQPPPPQASQHCAYCKTAGHLIAACPEKNSAICYKCSATGHIAKHCPSRLEAIRAQLADLLGRVQALPPEEVNLHKLVGLLERADLLTQPVWREESLQALARERLLPKLSAGLRERFLARCAAGGKRVTIRELKGFLVYELKTHPYRAQPQPPSSFTFGYGGGGRASEKATAEEQPSKQQPNCSKCGSKNHRTEQCADVRQILGVE